MAFCPNCGEHVDEGAKFCMSCGAQLPSAGPAAQAGQTTQRPAYEQQFYDQRQQASQQQSYPQESYRAPQPSYEQPSSKDDYHKLGGWLLFFTICWGITAASGLGTIIQILGSMGALFSYGFGGRLVLPAMAGILSALVSIAVSVLMIVLIVKRNQMFLRLYQIASIVEIAVSIVATAIMSSASAISGLGTMFESAGGGVGGVVGLCLMTMYFCKSARVKTYMGSTAYLDQALFKIGV